MFDPVPHAPPSGELISAVSPLRRLPTGLEREQLRLLTGIRVSLQQLDGSYRRLFHALDAVGCEERNEDSAGIGFDGVMAMADAWSFVDAAVLLVRLDQKLFAGEHDLLTPVEAARPVRNDRQHLEERLVKAAFEDQPDWGTLAWLYLEEPGTGVSRSFTLGHARTGVVSPTVNPASVDHHWPGPCHLQLHSFHGHAEISALYGHVRRYVAWLEARLAPIFEGHGHSHADILISLFFRSPEDSDHSDVGGQSSIP